MISMYDFKLFANISTTDSDAKISAAVNAANSLASSYTGLEFSSDPKTANLNPTEYLILPDTNVVSITEISFKGLGDPDINGDPTDLVVDADNYFLEPAGVVELVDVTLPTKKRSIKVTYTIDNNMPEDYKLAILELAHYYFKREYNKMEKSIGGEDVKFKDTSILPTQVKTILDNYRCL